MPRTGIAEAHAQGRAVDMTPHMAAGDTELGSINAVERSQEMKVRGRKLLTGSSFYLSGEYQIPSKAEIEMLIRLGDGILRDAPGENVIMISQRARPNEVPVSKLLDYVSVFDTRLNLLDWDGAYIPDDIDDGHGTPLF